MNILELVPGKLGLAQIDGATSGGAVQLPQGCIGGYSIELVVKDSQGNRVDSDTVVQKILSHVFGV